MNSSDIIKQLSEALENLMAESGGEPDMDDEKSIALWDGIYEALHTAETHVENVERPNFVLDCVEPHVAADSLEAINVECTVNEEMGQVHVIVPEDDEDFKNLIGLLQEQNFDMDVFHSSI